MDDRDCSRLVAIAAQNARLWRAIAEVRMSGDGWKILNHELDLAAQWWNADVYGESLADPIRVARSMLIMPEELH